MRLLVVMPHAPYPANSGARIRLQEELRYLSRRHDVTAVFFTEPDERKPPPSLLLGLCHRSVPVAHVRRIRPADLALSRGAPWPLRRYGTVEMDRALRGINSRSFDAVIVDTLYMTLYRGLFPRCAVLQEHNIESQIARQYAQRRPASAVPSSNGRDRAFWGAVSMLMERYEDRTWAQFPLRVAVSELEKAEIDRRCASGRTVVVENGVDVRPPCVRDELGSRVILFMGALDSFPNVDAAFYLAKRIMPAVWGRGPDIRLVIAGRHPDPALAVLRVDPRIQIVADPDDMRAVAARASVSAAPLRIGAGTRLKILQALAWGLPVVSTQLGCAGLGLTDGEHLVIRDDPDAFADALANLLSNGVMWRRLSQAGRAVVEQRNAWEPLLERFEAELYRLVSGFAPASADTPDMG
jgi:glycosyltransferase involved in cell wall biosynthesis